MWRCKTLQGRKQYLLLFHARTPMRNSDFRNISWGLVLLIALTVFYRQLGTTAPNPSGPKVDSTLESRDKPSEPLLQLQPGELPGYTGWARPDSTLAGHFKTVRPYPRTVVPVGTDWTATVQCHDCPDLDTWFYIRAYGPSVITGHVETIQPGMYRFHLVPLDPGVYTVEVVVTFSQVPPIDEFPLPPENAALYYEGYPLPISPFLLQVKDSLPAAPSVYCTAPELQAPNARWKVVDSVRSISHKDEPQGISLAGYADFSNSLGVRFDYQHVDCQLVQKKSIFWQNCEAIQHIVLIGDSVMRLQKDHLERWIADSTSSAVKVSFYELYGGVLRCDRSSGPKMNDIVSEISSLPDNTAVIFNTGLHDIHRLCGTGYADDRATYLTAQELEQSCTQNYQAALQTLLEAVQRIPSKTKLFQTSTAAWPKYGNYGIAWNPAKGQELPLDAGFIERFNDIAIQQMPSGIDIVDGYHVTLARPDHREVDEKSRIGKKLSHPGPSVVSVLVRTWAQRIFQTICPNVLL